MLRRCSTEWVTMAEDLADRAGGVIEDAIARARNPEVEAELRGVRDRLDGPLRVAIAGKVKAGKSTLLNALLGEELAPTDAGECTKIVTWYLHGHAPQVRLFPVDGETVDRRFTRQGGALEVDLGSRALEEIDHLEVSWPTERLRDLTILDTPGIASISAEVSERTQRVMASEDGRVPVADAVVYLLRHAHASDVRFLEAFHDDELAHGTPMNAIGVLSRADEIGSCRLDALDVADRVARRYETDARLRRLCPVVVPVDGLLAYTAATLRESEFALLARIAALPAEELGQLLLSVDRLAERDSGLDMTSIERRHLLDRFGLFGVRLGVDLIRSGATPNAVELARVLAGRAGLMELRSVLVKQFQERSRVLKARSAITALEAVLAADGCRDTPQLRGQLERVLASAHEFEEVRVLGALRVGGLDLRGDAIEDLERLLGGFGHDPATRLGLPGEAEADEVRATALSMLTTWHARAQHPLSTRSTQLAARTAIRTLEGIVADLARSGFGDVVATS